jgi:solute carrier family 35 protein
MYTFHDGLLKPFMEYVLGVNAHMYRTQRHITVTYIMIMEYFLAKQKHTLPIIGGQNG